MMNKLALYVFPLGVVVGGPFLPLAIIFYWFANNIWTFGQQHYVFGMIEREEEEQKREAIERRSANAPAPGAKPKRPPRNASPGGNGSAATSTEGYGEITESSSASDQVGRAPRPGARPKKRRR
jgi:YidC/Oxa1 family membrane protein insertase